MLQRVYPSAFPDDQDQIYETTATNRTDPFPHFEVLDFIYLHCRFCGQDSRDRTEKGTKPKPYLKRRGLRGQTINTETTCPRENARLPQTTLSEKYLFVLLAFQRFTCINTSTFPIMWIYLCHSLIIFCDIIIFYFDNKKKILFLQIIRV